MNLLPNTKKSSLLSLLLVEVDKKTIENIKIIFVFLATCSGVRILLVVLIDQTIDEKFHIGPLAESLDQV